MNIEGEKVGIVTVEKRKLVKEIVEYAIVLLDNPTKTGSTHAMLSDTGSVVGLLRYDEEGQFLVDQLITSGTIDMYFLD